MGKNRTHSHKKPNGSAASQPASMMLFRTCSVLSKASSSHSDDIVDGDGILIVQEDKPSTPQRISLARGNSAGIATVKQSSYEVEIEDERVSSAAAPATTAPRPYSTSTLLRPHMSLRELLLPSSSSASLDSNTSPKGGSGVFTSRMSIDQRTSSFRVRSVKKGSASLMNLIFPISSRNTQVENGRQLFSGFLQRCYSVEVLEFWDGTSKYICLAKQQQPGNNSTRHVDLAKRLIAEYLLPDSKQKLDLGWEIEDPLIEAYEGKREFTAGSFDSCRKLLFKLMLGLKMDANVSYGGAKIPNAVAIAMFLDDEERKMHQMRFQRDVHPLLHLLRRNTTVEGRGSALGVCM